MQVNPGLHGWVRVLQSSMSRTDREKWSEIKERRDNSKGTNPRCERPEGGSLATLLYQSMHTSHSCILLDNFVVCVSDIFSFFSYLRAFHLHTSNSGIGCLNMPQFLPLGANSTTSVCAGGGQRIGFYPPLCSP